MSVVLVQKSIDKYAFSAEKKKDEGFLLTEENEDQDEYVLHQMLFEI